MSANIPDNSIVLSLLDPAGKTVGSSHAPGTELAENFSFTISLDTGALPPQNPQARAGQSPSTAPLTDSEVRSQETGSDSQLPVWSVAVSLTREAREKGLFSLALNVLTLLVITLTVMLEGLLIFFHFARAASPGAALKTSSKDSSPLRALIFLFVLAKDLSISFIPLRMGELYAGGEAHPALLGLPVSAEIALAACGIMLAGVWIKRQGLAAPMSCGIILAMLGNLFSLPDAGPALFILARSLAGAGYGLVLLPAQVMAVKEGKLAFLFAGVYGGSLCGSALGAMLADYLGYTLVFGISALLMLMLTSFPILLFKGRGDENAAKPVAFGLRRGLSGLLFNPAFLALICFSLIPAAFLDIGLMNYFLPVFLHEAGIAQSDIGRIFMLYCLTLICLGPFAERIIHARRAESVAVFLGCLACAAAVGGFLLLPPLAASLSGALFLGLAACCNIPGQSACLLRLKAAKSLGVELSMSVLNTVERAGQMVGPLCIGALFAAVSVSSLALGGSIAAVGAGAAFLLSTHFASRSDRPGQKA
jgi:predicted MFS family arabinose efflux permease